MQEREDNSQYAVDVRRKWVAEQYLAGITPVAIWNQYSSRYNLSKKSLENDITEVRKNLSFDIREEYEQVLNNELLFLYSIREKALKEGDSALALRTTKHVNDLLRLVNPDKTHGNKINVYNQFNQQVISGIKDMGIEELRVHIEELKKLQSK